MVSSAGSPVALQEQIALVSAGKVQYDAIMHGATSKTTDAFHTWSID